MENERTISATAARYDTTVRGDGTVTETVVNAVAEATGRSPLDLSPLYRVIDPDALDALFDPRIEGRASARMSFSYEGRRVTVRGDGGVSVADDDR